MNEGFINLDFADVSTIMKNAGYAHMAIGTGTGKEKVSEATKQVITSPLLETSIKGARRLLVNIVASDDILIDEVNEVASIIQSAAAPNVEIIFGASYMEDKEDEISVTVIAADFALMQRLQVHLRIHPMSIYNSSINVIGQLSQPFII